MLLFYLIMLKFVEIPNLFLPLVYHRLLVFNVPNQHHAHNLVHNTLNMKMNQHHVNSLPQLLDQNSSQLQNQLAHSTVRAQPHQGCKFLELNQLVILFTQLNPAQLDQMQSTPRVRYHLFFYQLILDGSFLGNIYRFLQHLNFSPVQ